VGAQNPSSQPQAANDTRSYTPEEIIRSLYRGVLGRDPDPDGNATYVEALRKRMPVEQIVSTFVQSNEFTRKIHRQFINIFDEEHARLFPLEFEPPPAESGKSYLTRRANGFLQRFMSGEVVLDIGYKGYDNPRGTTVVAHAIGVDMDYPGYDGLHLPFADNSVDSVYSSHCLEHIESYQIVIRDWHRVLKVGGFLICAVPSQLLYEKKKNLPSRYNADHKRFYSPTSLLKEFQESLEENSYRVRHLEENDAGYDYTIGPETHPVGCYEIVLVLEKIDRPSWTLAE
jgi:SAM-dependent methyltransferase